MDQNTATQRAILDWLRAWEGERLGMLERLVDSVSPQGKLSVDRTGEVQKQFFTGAASLPRSRPPACSPARWRS